MIVCYLYGGIDSGCFSSGCSYRTLLLMENKHSAEKEEKRYDETDFKGNVYLLS